MIAERQKTGNVHILPVARRWRLIVIRNASTTLLLLLMRNARRSGTDSIRSRPDCQRGRCRQHRHQDDPPPDTRWCRNGPSRRRRWPSSVGHRRVRPHRRAFGGCCRMRGSTNPAAATAGLREDAAFTSLHSIK